MTKKKPIDYPVKSKMSDLIVEASRFVSIAKTNEPGLSTWLDAFHGSSKRLRDLLENAREAGVENDTWGKST